MTMYNTADRPKERTVGLTSGAFTVVADATSPRGTLHTANVANNGKHYVDLYVQNKHTAAVELTLEIHDGTTSLGTMIVSVGTKTAPVKVLESFQLKNGEQIRASAATAAVVTAWGQVLERAAW